MRGKQYPLSSFEPFPITKGRYALAGPRLSRIRYRFHNEKDPINDGLPDHKRILIDEYRNGKSYPLFRVEDLNEIFKRETYNPSQDGGLEANIRGFLAERKGRSMLKEVLKHQRYGKMLGLYEGKLENEQYWLEIDSYPNIYLHSKKEERCIAEVDGLFPYGQRTGTRKKPAHDHHMFILESKVGDFSLRANDLIPRILDPLRTLEPNHQQTLVLTTQANNNLFGNERRRILQPKIVQLYKELQATGRKLAIMTFPASAGEFEEMTKHIMIHYFWNNRLPRMLPLKVLPGENELSIYNGGQRPLVKLVRDPNNPRGWLEVDE